MALTPEELARGPGRLDPLRAAMPPNLTTPEVPTIDPKSLRAGMAGSPAIDPASLKPGVGVPKVAAAPGMVEGGLRALARWAAPVALGTTAANTAMTPTEDYQTRFAMNPADNNASAGKPGDPMSGIENLKQFGRDVGTRMLGAYSDLGNTMTGGLAGNFFADKQAQAAAPVVPAAGSPTPGGTQNAMDARLANGSVTTSPPGTDVAPGIRRDGNNYFGTEALTKPGVSTIGGGDEGMQRNLRAAAILKAGNDQIKANAQTEPLVLNARTLGQANTEAFNSTPSYSTLKSGYGGSGVLQERQADRAEQARIANQSNSTTLRGQDLNYGATKEGHAVQLRGQDLNYDATTRGQDSTARTAANAARIEQMNKDRTYQFEVQKHGDTVAKNNFEMRQQAQKDVTSRVASMLPKIVGLDGKPTEDSASAARLMTGLNAKLATIEGSLREKAAAGDKRAAAALDDLGKNGVAALGEQEIRRHVLGDRANQANQAGATHPLMPVGGTGVQTDIPTASLRMKDDGYFGTSVGRTYEHLDEKGNPTGQITPARHIESDGSWVFGPKRNDLRDLIRK